MTTKVTVETNINIPNNLKKIKDRGFWVYSAATWHKLYSPFVPMQTGNLMEDVVIGAGTIEHTAPYAQRNYAGRFNFKKDKHPMASRLWDKAAEPSQKPKLIKSMQAYVDSGKLRLSK